MNNQKNILNRTLPFYFNTWKRNFFVALGISLFAVLFMAIYKPFNLLREELQNFQLISDGLITLIVIFGSIQIAKKIFPNFYKSENGTIGKYLVFNIYIIFVLGLLITIHSHIFFEPCSISEWVRIQRNVSLIGIFPVLIVFGLLRNYQLKKNLLSHNIQPYSADSLLKNNGAKQIKITTDTAEIIVLNINDFIYAEAQNNYTKVVWREENLEKEKLFRLTLKKFESQIPAKYVFRSHRSYLINRAQVHSMEGSMRNGIKVKLINSNQELPVSRSLGKELESIISNRKVAI